jgi:hypothetical protein
MRKNKKRKKDRSAQSNPAKENGKSLLIKNPWVLIICTTLFLILIFTIILVWINATIWETVSMSVGGWILIFLIGYIFEKFLENVLFKKAPRRWRKYLYILLVSLVISAVLSNLPVTKTAAAKFHSIFEEETYISASVSENETIENNATAPDRASMEPYDYLMYAQNRNVEFVLNANTTPYMIFYETIYLMHDDMNPMEYLYSIWGKRLDEAESDYYTFYSADENSFYLQRDKAKDHLEMTGYKDIAWVEMLPKETDLLHVIQQQEAYVKDHPSYYLYCRLSINYQAIAQEHLHQDENNLVAKYYYQLSILNDLEALKFAGYDNDFNTVIERLYYRYGDINYCEVWNNDDEKSRVNYLVQALEW